MPQRPAHYPFSAIVGCDTEQLDDLGLALVLTSVSPDIGGVLVRGQKGTAKSTAVRALASLLPPVEVYRGDRFSVDPADPSQHSPDGPFGPGTAVESRPVNLVDLPVGATEDRVLGSLHLEQALTHGKVAYEPGLLARAHRGLLYVDEVNLLHDHLVDLLLDAAATGRVTVERDGFSVEHAAKFLLIGTMNPEEGELRPQLLDRFGLTVEVTAPTDPSARAEVVRRRMAYDADPGGFASGYHEAEEALADRIAKARGAVERVHLSQAALLKIAEVCAAFEVDGLRADIVTSRAAVAHAAWAGREAVTRADIRRAALLTLPHRRRRNPFDAPGLDEELLDRVLGDEDPPPDPPEPPQPPESPDDPSEPSEPEDADPSQGSDRPEQPPEDAGPDAPGPENSDGPDQSAEAEATEQPPNTDTEQDVGEGPGDAGPPPPSSDRATSTVGSTAPYRARKLTVRGAGQGADGKRSRAVGRRGRRIGAAPPGSGSGSSLHLVETVRAAAAAPREGERMRIRPQDLRVAVREGQESNLILFCVDASGSMAARKRMSEVKTAILSLLLDAYRRRDKVGLITFRARQAELALPPTNSVDVAAARLEDMPAGGRTPLDEGLLEADRVLRREQRRAPRLRPLLVVVTDGRATGARGAVERSLAAADHIAGQEISSVVVDSESGPMRLGLALGLAARLGAEHLPVGEVNAEALNTAVRERAA
ncbi:VWA domain-containing protein [Nocardiopsis salina]|uniref:VWA domain-containing protein n=1 Tax=Nocardiopsis salina TaxID=245836 RepID=UPI00034DB940|nr:VWA domain-containing protein [Nocardiopsis salina]